MEEQFARAVGGAWVAAAAERVRRTGAVGHLRARLAGRKRAGALPGADDRRRYQPELGPFRGKRCNTSKYGRAVGIPREEWPDGGRVHGSRFNVRGAATARGEQEKTARGRPADAVGTSVAGAGNGFHSGVLAPGEGADRAKFLKSTGSSGKASASGKGLVFGTR